MRLTLRTLLAYLDDRLTPADARELGQKVTKSPFATDLADRIKDVQRRRRLADDTAGKKSIEANLVAEYLDDQLTPELVGLIEKEILSSDRSLAEVAASHQIIGTLGEPQEIPADLKNRLYSLGPKQPESTATSDSDLVDEEAETAAWEPLEPQSPSVRRTPLILLSLMALGWLALLASDPNLFRTEKTVLKTAQRNDAVAVKEEVPEPKAPPENDAEQSADIPETSNEAGVEAAVAAKTPQETGKATTAEFSVAKNTAETVTPVAARVTQPQESNKVEAKSKQMDSDPVVVKDPLTPDGSTEKPPEKSVEKPETENTPLPPKPGLDVPLAENVASDLFYDLVDTHSMLVLRQPEDSAWKWASDITLAANGNWHTPLQKNVAGITKPFSVSIVENGAGWRTEILGPSLFVAAGQQEAGIRLFEGRMLLENHVAGQNDAAVGVFTLLAGGRRLEVAIPPSKAFVGVEVIPHGVSNVNDKVGNDTELLPLENAADILIFAPTHDVTVDPGAGAKVVTITQGTAMLWAGARDGQDELPEVDANSVLSIPEWVFEAKQRKTESTQNVISSTADDLTSHSSISSGVRALSQNRNPQMAAYAIKLPSLMRDVDDLTAFLIESDEDVVRQEAATGLRRVIRQALGGLPRVQSSLENRMSEVEVKNTLTLLKGVTMTAAEDRNISKWLVSMLSSNRPCIQSLAIANLESLTGERYGFFAGDDSGRRDTAIKRWKRFLGRNDGRLKPIDE